MILDKLNEVLGDNKLGNRHSFFQLRFFVLGKEPTTQGKLHQCLLELKSRKSSLEAIILEIEETKDQKQLLELNKKEIASHGLTQMGTKLGDIDKEKMKIQSRQLDRRITSIDAKLDELEVKILDIEEEVGFFLRAYDTLSSQEQVKDWDNFEVQAAYWNAKFTKEVNIRGLLGRPIDVELMKSILSLNDESPVKKETIRLIEEHAKQIEESKIDKIDLEKESG